MSKRHKKERQRNRKPRDEWVQFKARGDADRKIAIRTDKDTGDVSSPQAIDETFRTYQSYQRDSGKEKVTYQAHGQPSTANLSLRNGIASRFDVIAGIDTNRFQVAGRDLSITFSFASSPVLRENPDELELDPAPGFIFENVRAGINPETIGWYHFLVHVLPLVSGNGSYSVALVVDSELGALPAINNRTRPFYKQFTLPSNVELVYASSDSGTDVPNKLIKECDKASREIVRQIDMGEMSLPERLEGGADDFAGAASINIPGSAIQLRPNK